MFRALMLTLWVLLVPACAMQSAAPPSTSNPCAGVPYHYMVIVGNANGVTLGQTYVLIVDRKLLLGPSPGNWWLCSVFDTMSVVVGSPRFTQERRLLRPGVSEFRLRRMSEAN